MVPQPNLVVGKSAEAAAAACDLASTPLLPLANSRLQTPPTPLLCMRDALIMSCFIYESDHAPCKKLGLAAIMLKILRFILIRHCLGWPLPPRPGECFDGSSGGSYPINRGSSVLSTSNEDSRLVWTSSFIHSLARAQLGVGAGGVVGVASLLGTGPEWGKGGRGKTLHRSVPFFK